MKRTIINPVIRDTATFLRTARETNAHASELEITLMPSGGNILHYHKTYSETFIAVNGKLGLRLGKNKTMILKPGERYTVKPLQLHCFFNPSNTDKISFRILIEPGHEGFENSLRIIYGLAADGLTDQKSIPKKLSHTALVLTMSDMNAPGLLTWIFPFLKWLASRPKVKAEEARLLAQYC
jgi:mannose-6-phosphate isomerase-like protein (cupin superfamily)